MKIYNSKVSFFPGDFSLKRKFKTTAASLVHFVLILFEEAIIRYLPLHHISLIQRALKHKRHFSVLKKRGKTLIQFYGDEFSQANIYH